MATKKRPDERGAPEERPARDESPHARSSETQADSKKPTKEIRIGRLKAVIWANQPQAAAGGVRHNVKLVRIYKPDDRSQWQESPFLGRDDLLAAAEVLRQAWLWIHENGHS
jgi:hypothetical protein